MSMLDVLKNNFARNTSLWIMFIVLFSLTGCTLHITNDIADRLDPDELYKSYNVYPADLSVHSKCEKRPTIKIVNVETRIADYEAMENPPFYGVINPKEMMDGFSLYLEKGFKQGHIKVDDYSIKILQVKMVDLKSIVGVWTFGSNFKMELILPETGFTKFYESRDNARNGYTAAAYAIHAVTRQIIDDPEIQDYILCKDKDKKFLQGQKDVKAASISLTQKLQELQAAYENGLISKEEYQLKRKAILEKH